MLNRWPLKLPKVSTQKVTSMLWKGMHCLVPPPRPSPTPLPMPLPSQPVTQRPAEWSLLCHLLSLVQMLTKFCSAWRGSIISLSKMFLVMETFLSMLYVSHYLQQESNILVGQTYKHGLSTSLVTLSLLMNMHSFSLHPPGYKDSKWHG